ncbi:MAG: hypothetical protein JEZ11_03730 [Desulfobacterales bacterium]|nr:hypothetical protein [Desulfobacterales bacterium]
MSHKIIRAKHPSGLTIAFDPGPHRYVVEETGQVMTSVTTFIEQFFPKFDAPAIALKCSRGKKPKYAGRDPVEIMAEWEANAERARDEGTVTHLYAECLLTNQTPPEPISERTVRLFQCVDQSVRLLLKHYEFVASEAIIFSPKMAKSGTIDLVMRHKETGVYLILDWKQNAEIARFNQWQKCLPPIGHLDDCDLNHYSLQLSMYKKMVLTEGYWPEAKGWKMGLIHLKEFGTAENIPIEDCEREIDMMLDYEKAA